VPVGVVGQDATRTMLNDSDQFLATQIKLVQSDSVLRPVDQQFHLRQEEKQSEASGSMRGEQSPVTLKQLKVMRPPNTYLIQISYRSADPQLAGTFALEGSATGTGPAPNGTSDRSPRRSRR